MRDVLDTLCRWQETGVRFALATVTSTSRSAPRGIGATLALHPDGEVVGSVSGGCVEGAVVGVAETVLQTGEPTRVQYGISDDEAIAVGLTCGGTIEVFIRPCTQEVLDLRMVAGAINDEKPLAVVTLVDHKSQPTLNGTSLVVMNNCEAGGQFDDNTRTTVVEAARSLLSRGESALLTRDTSDEKDSAAVEFLVEAFRPRPRMIIFGAIDYAGAVARIGAFLGYHVTVCDARERFATESRFPDADQVIVAWPHRYLASTHVDHRTAICVLTHDPKFDVPAVQQALQSEAGYIGVMGSRRSHENRLERLRSAGVDQTEFDRLRSPIGLDLGGRTPMETAVSIGAELIMLQRGGSGRALRDTNGPIHPR